MKDVISSGVARRVFIGVAALHVMCVIPGTVHAASSSWTAVSATVADRFFDDAIQYSGADSSFGSIITQTEIYYGETDAISKETLTSYERFAEASLSSGSLKAKTGLSYGASQGDTTQPGDAAVVSVSATIADSFSVSSGESPFLWTDGTAVRFKFSATGENQIPDGLIPYDFVDGHEENVFLSELTLSVYSHGTSRLIAEYTDFCWDCDYGAVEPWERYDWLAATIQARELTSKVWGLGEQLAGHANPLPLDPTTPTVFDFEFSPGGDFDWTLTLNQVVAIDASHENISGVLDFSHTLTAAFEAPEGAAVYSASGLFPGTLAVVPVPESETYAMFLAGLALMARRIRCMQVAQG